MTSDTQLLIPNAGFVVKTYKTSAAAYEASGKIFVNICSSDLVERAQGSGGNSVSNDHLDNKGLSNLQIPLLLGPARKMTDSSGHEAIAVDVIYHPTLVERAIKGSPQHSAEHFRGYLIDLALKNVSEDLKVKIERFKIQILEKVKYKGPTGESASNTCAFEVVSVQAKKKEEQPKPTQPKIEVIGEIPADPKKRSAGSGSKPIIRKGFFDKPGKAADGDGSLYPEGSDEGVPLPGQGDAVNFMPEKMRNTCHMIDPTKMDPTSLQAAMEAYAKTGRLDGNMPGVYKKGEDIKHGAVNPGLGAKSASSSSSQAASEPSTSAAKKEKKKEPEKELPVTDSMFKFVGQLEEPVYRVEETTLGGQLAMSIFVEVPKVSSLGQLTLDVTDTLLQVRGANYRLKLELPQSIDSSMVKAKFTSKKKELKIVAPVRMC